MASLRPLPGETATPIPRDSDPSTVARARKAALILAFLSGLIGASVLLGWLLDIRFLKSLAPGLATMKANTALAFLLAGFAAGKLAFQGRPARPWAAVLGAAVFLIGFLSGCEYLLRLDLGIDELLFRDRESALHPGRMAPMTSISFCIAGVALLAASRTRWREAQSASALLLLVSMVSLLGYAYGVDSLYRVAPYTSIALHTAVAFHLLALSMLFLDPSKGIPAVFLSRTAGGMTARRLLPIIPPALFILGGIAQAGARRDWFDPIFAIAVLAALCIFFSAGIVLWHAGVLQRTDLARTFNEEEVRRLNESLEEKVAERTRQLRESLDHIKRLQGLLPVCAWCKKIRNDENYWQTLETYITEHTEARITHAICPECTQRVRDQASPNFLPIKDL